MPGTYSAKRGQKAKRLALRSVLHLEMLSRAPPSNLKIHIGVILYLLLLKPCGPGSSVGIATDYGQDGPGSNPCGDEIFRPSRPAMGPTPASCKMGIRSFPGVKCGRSVLLTTHPFLVPRSWKSRAIPLPTLWATPGL